MNSLQPPPSIAEPSGYEMGVFVRHLAHEMRQPLSGIESITYYLEMVLQNAEPNVRAQLNRMHHLVQQASWILCDSVHAMRNAAPARRALDINFLVAEFTADGALHDEANFRLAPGPALRPWLSVDISFGIAMMDYLMV